MNLREIGYSWFKILAGYSESNSKKGNFLRTEKSVCLIQLKRRENPELSKREKKRSCLPAALSPSWLAAVSLEMKSGYHIAIPKGMGSCQLRHCVFHLLLRMLT